MKFRPIWFRGEIQPNPYRGLFDFPSIPDHHPITHHPGLPTEALGDFTFWRHMEPSYAAISMASYTEAESVGPMDGVLLSGKGCFLGKWRFS